MSRSETDCGQMTRCSQSAVTHPTSFDPSSTNESSELSTNRTLLPIEDSEETQEGPVLLSAADPENQHAV